MADARVSFESTRIKLIENKSKEKFKGTLFNNVIKSEATKKIHTQEPSFEFKPNITPNAKL